MGKFNKHKTNLVIMNKVVYIIPGFSESTKQKAYQEIAKFFKRRKFKSISVKLSWKYKTMSDYINQFMGQYKYNKNVYLFGFSFGAMISFICSTKINPKALILCSLSPYFKEDLPYIKNSWRSFIGKKRFNDLKKYSFSKLIRQVKCKTILLAGSKESPELLKRVNDANKKLKNSKIIIIKNAKHKISQKEYLDAIKNLVFKI